MRHRVSPVLRVDWLIILERVTFTPTENLTMARDRMTVRLDRDDVTLIVAALATMRVEAETNATNMAAVPDDMRDDDAVADVRALVADLQGLSDRLVTGAVYAARYR